MTDEASTNYISVIDQLMEGHQWVMENLGIKPTSGWSVDPFGHSATMPYLWKQAGISNMVISRIHQAIKGSLILEGSLEFYWKQYWDAKGSGDIFCHVMPYLTYSLQNTCGPNSFVCIMYDFKHVAGRMEYNHVKPITDENIEKKSQALYEQYRLKAGLYKHNTILVPLGDDFRFNEIEEWDQQYENYKKLMSYMENQTDWKITVKFGTLKDYFDIVKKKQTAESIQFSSLSGDFFPYSDHDKAYWTGYFTTRPFDKRFSREVESRLRAAEILNSLAVSYSKLWQVPYLKNSKGPRLLAEARHNLGLFLHHDAITGTAKSYVVEDYEEKLLKAFENAFTILSSSAQFLLTKGKLDSDPAIFQPELSRTHYKEPSMHHKISPSMEGTRVLLFNPVGKTRSEFVEIIVDTVDFDIKDSKRRVVPYQINPVFVSITEVDRTSFEVVFLTEIAAFGIETYIFQTTNKTPKLFWSKISIYNSEELIVAPELKFDQTRPRHRGNVYEPIYIENQQISVEFKSYNGLMSSVKDKSNNRTKETKVLLEFKQYVSRGSGAYIFFPNGPAGEFLEGTPVVRLIEGPFSSEVQVSYACLYHRAKLYNHPGLQGRNIFMQNALNMFVVNMRDREPIMRFATSVQNEAGKFFTDENGFQMIGRTFNNLKIQNIERNYYPLTTMAFIQDEFSRVTLHSGQAHGVASLEKGWLEVMIERQLLYDDERGLGEGISDNKLTMTKYMLQVEHSQTSLTEDKFSFPSLQSLLTNEFLNQPIQKFYSPINSDIVSMNFLPMQHSLPCDIFLVNLKTLFKSDQSYNGTSLIVHRKGYRCGFPDDGLLCSDSNVNVTDLFPRAKNEHVRVTSLTHLETKPESVQLDNLFIPSMEIKSFIVDVKP